MRTDTPAAPPPPVYRTRLYRDYLTLSDSVRPEGFEAYYRTWARVARGHFAKLLPAERNARILDLGCGHGTMLYTLKTMGFSNLVGVDGSPEQIELARQVHPEVVRAGALEFLASSPGRFDVVLAVNLLEHFNKDEALLLVDRSHAVLKPGGRILLQLPNGDGLRGRATAAGDLGHEVCYSARSVEQLLRLAGFEDVRCHPAGPVPHGLLSSLRWVLWKGIDSITRFYDLVETGRVGTGVHTRVMTATGTRRPRSPSAARAVARDASRAPRGPGRCEE